MASHHTDVVVALAARSNRWRSVCRGCLWMSLSYADKMTAVGMGEAHTYEMAAARLT